jgi:outer membrane protein TolC
MALVFLPLSIFASDITSLVNSAYDKNPQIQLLKEKIKAKDFDIQNSTIDKNPMLSFGVTDINLNEPLKRDLEAMQTHYISVAQEFTDKDKQNSKKDIAILEKQIIQTKLNLEIEQLTKKLYKYYFEYKKLCNEIRLINKKIKNIQHIKSFHTSHINHEEAYQASINNDLTLEKLKLKLIKIEQKKEQIFIDISELVNEKITAISISKDLLHSDTLDENHLVLQIKKLQIKKAKAINKLAKNNTSSDFTLSAGYYQRESRDDYLNLGVKIPLQIYNKEDNLIKQSKIKINEATHELESLKNQLIKSLYTNISNKKLEKLTISSLEKIIQLQEKELNLITNQNNMNTLLQALNLKNKIIDNKLQINTQNYLLNIASLELAYLGGNLRISHE